MTMPMRPSRWTSRLFVVPDALWMASTIRVLCGRRNTARKSIAIGDTKP